MFVITPDRRSHPPCGSNTGAAARGQFSIVLEVVLRISEPRIGYQDRVFVVPRPASCAFPLIGTVIHQWRPRHGTSHYTVVLDGPTDLGHCIIDVPDNRLILLRQS